MFERLLWARLCSRQGTHHLISSICSHSELIAMFSPLTDGEVKLVAQTVRGRSRSQIFLSPHTQTSSQRVVTATVPFHAIIQWLPSAFMAQLRPHSRASQQHCTQCYPSSPVWDNPCLAWQSGKAARRRQHLSSILRDEEKFSRRQREENVPGWGRQCERSTERNVLGARLFGWQRTSCVSGMRGVHGTGMKQAGG